MNSHKVFIDLDGVLVDFDAGVFNYFNAHPENLDLKIMWERLSRIPGFYDSLPWSSDGRELWAFAKKYEPTILTGLPRGNWAEAQKRSWCRRELGEEIPVITCWSREKALHGRQATPEGVIPVLVDDRERLAESWREMGGIFIHHQSARESIAALELLLESGG